MGHTPTAKLLEDAEPVDVEVLPFGTIVSNPQDVRWLRSYWEVAAKVSEITGRLIDYMGDDGVRAAGTGEGEPPASLAQIAKLTPEQLLNNPEYRRLRLQVRHQEIGTTGERSQVKAEAVPKPKPDRSGWVTITKYHRDNWPNVPSKQTLHRWSKELELECLAETDYSVDGRGVRRACRKAMDRRLKHHLTVVRDET